MQARKEQGKNAAGIVLARPVTAGICRHGKTRNSVPGNGPDRSCRPGKLWRDAVSKGLAGRDATRKGNAGADLPVEMRQGK